MFYIILFEAYKLVICCRLVRESVKMTVCLLIGSISFKDICVTADSARWIFVVDVNLCVTTCVTTSVIISSYLMDITLI